MGAVCQDEYLTCRFHGQVLNGHQGMAISDSRAQFEAPTIGDYGPRSAEGNHAIRI